MRDRGQGAGGAAPRGGRLRGPIGIAGAAVASLVLLGCVHAPRPLGREIVWEGEVTVRDDVLVPPGATLLIRPGTRVRFAFRDDNGDGRGDARIVVRGAVRAVGSETAPIAFTPEREGDPEGWAEILVEDATGAVFARCRFAGAQQAVHAHRTPLAIEACRFERNAIGARFTGGPVTIRASRFTGNGTAVRYWESSPEIAGCSFEGNTTGVFVREGSSRTVLAGNNFAGSADYHVKLGELQSADVEAPGNWWGTLERGEIERLIYDREDAEYLGRVRYDPPAKEPLRLDTP